MPLLPCYPRDHALARCSPVDAPLCRDSRWSERPPALPRARAYGIVSSWRSGPGHRRADMTTSWPSFGREKAVFADARVPAAWSGRPLRSGDARQRADVAPIAAQGYDPRHCGGRYQSRRPDHHGSGPRAHCRPLYRLCDVHGRDARMDGRTEPPPHPHVGLDGRRRDESVEFEDVVPRQLEGDADRCALRARCRSHGRGLVPIPGGHRSLLAMDAAQFAEPQSPSLCPRLVRTYQTRVNRYCQRGEHRVSYAVAARRRALCAPPEAQSGIGR